MHVGHEPASVVLQVAHYGELLTLSHSVAHLKAQDRRIEVTIQRKDIVLSLEAMFHDNHMSIVSQWFVVPHAIYDPVVKSIYRRPSGPFQIYSEVNGTRSREELGCVHALTIFVKPTNREATEDLREILLTLFLCRELTTGWSSEVLHIVVVAQFDDGMESGTIFVGQSQWVRIGSKGEKGHEFLREAANGARSIVAGNGATM